MQQTFLQKLMLTVIAGALAAGVYVFFYEKIVVAGDESLNGAYRNTKPAAHSTPRRF